MFLESLLFLKARLFGEANGPTYVGDKTLKVLLEGRQAGEERQYGRSLPPLIRLISPKSQTL